MNECVKNDFTYNEMHIWCLDNFGLTGSRYLYRPGDKFMTYSFREENDAVLFSLRWGGSIDVDNE